MSKLTPSAPTLTFLPTMAVGSAAAAAYLFSVGAPRTEATTVLVVSVTVLALAALGKKGLGGLVLAAAVLVGLASFVPLDSRIPTAGEVASNVGAPDLPSMPDVSVGRPAEQAPAASGAEATTNP